MNKKFARLNAQYLEAATEIVIVTSVQSFIVAKW